MILEKKLKEARLKKDWTRKRLGTSLGVNAQYIYSCEAGTAKYSTKHFKKLSKQLDIPIRKMVKYRLEDIKRRLTDEIGIRKF